MTINKRLQQYTETPPNRQDPASYSPRADYLAAYIPPLASDIGVMADEFNATASTVNSLEQSSKASKEAAELAAQIANSSANIKGAFQPGTTNALQGETWTYEGLFWFALVNTSATPSESSDDWVSLSKHNSLTNRDETGAHPASAITMPSGLSVSQEILIRLPSVLDYGAKADGSDASQAFINALAEHDHVVVPNIGGTYLIDERIILSDGKKITGLGMPTLKLKGKNWGDTDAQSAGIFVIPFDVKGCVIERMRLDGNAGNHTATNLTNVEVVECDGYDNTVQFCEIFNSQADGIDSDGSMDLSQRRRQRNKFLYNVIYNCRGYGIHNSIGSWGNFCIGNEIFNCGQDLQRGGIDSYYGNSSLYSWGEHIITSNKCYNNYRNFNIRGEYLSAFYGNIHYGGAQLSILSKVTSPLRHFQNEQSSSIITHGSVKDIRNEGVYSLAAGVTDTPNQAGALLTVLELGMESRLKYRIEYPTIGGELSSKSFVMSYDGQSNTFTPWYPEFNAGNEFQLGYNQSWQNVLAQRAGNQVFTNTTGKPIYVSVSTNPLAGPLDDAHQVRQSASSEWISVGQASQSVTMSTGYVVPAGWQYRCQTTNIKSWSELR